MLTESGVPVDFVRRGTRIILHDDLYGVVLHPGVNDTQTRLLSVNDTSVVLGIESRAGRTLLWGDAETNVFRFLVRTDDLSAEVVQLPHHGSKVEPPMDRILSRWKNVIISARESFVRRERLRTLEAAGCKVFPTWRCGAVRVYLDGNRPEVTVFTRGCPTGESVNR